MKNLLITLTILLTLTVSASAQSPQISGATATLITAGENGKPTDYLGGIVLNFGVLFIVTYAQNVDIQVNVPDRNGKLITTGTVVLRADGKDYPVSYAGPAPFFEGYQQINIPVAPDDFPAGKTVYLRICDLNGNCKNSTGATVRVAP